MTKQELNKAKERWNAQCQEVQSGTPLLEQDTPRKKASRIKRAMLDYAFFVETYFPHYAKFKCAKFQIDAANKLQTSQTIKAEFQWPRAHAKSTHFDVFIPLWLKAQHELKVMVLVGKSEDNADTLLSDVQAEFEFNQRYINDFGQQRGVGSWEDGQFVTADGCAFFSRGRGQSPRGLRYREFRPDYIVCDDIDDDTLSRNPARVEQLVRWIKEALFGALDGGAGRFIIAGNMISKNSIIYAFSQNPEVYVSKVNAINEHGRPSWPEKFTLEQLKKIEDFQGYRSFQREYMNNPITEGAVFKNDWIKWGPMLPLKEYDEIVCYIDPSWTNSASSDYKACKVWGRKGNQLHHLRAFVRRCSVLEMVKFIYDFDESLPQDVIVRYYMEAGFIQSMLLDEFDNEGERRGRFVNICPDKRKKPDKFARIENISPLYERGLITYNESMRNDQDMQRGLDQTLAFEKGSNAHDDAPDADEGAIWMLQKDGRSSSWGAAISGINNKPASLW